MKSIATAVSTINVPFHGAELYVVNHNGEPYTPMKPIVEGMGLDWKSQHKKISQRFSKGMVEITIPFCRWGASHDLYGFTKIGSLVEQHQS
nr:phage antirepressor N-terminal domain-containing protein [Escherichia coli]